MRSFKQIGVLRVRLLAWFRRNRRRLPWRVAARSARGRTRHAYRVWVSEIMLQQTRVATVLPYYQRFLRRFPTVWALARARTDEVLRHWAGLGYYQRARNLHRAAKEIVARYRGRFPADYAETLALPGIGPYTAAAILSIAYGQPYAVLDGNVVRVVARLGCLSGDLRSSSYHKKLKALADAFLPHSAPGDFNQAMMELGATICLPRQPLCARCPLESLCLARKAGLESVLPGRRLKPARVTVHLAVGIAERNGKVLLVRERGGFFSGLWQFPSAAAKAGASPGDAVWRTLRNYGLHARSEGEIGEVRHSVTHHDVRLHVFPARVEAGTTNSRANTRWVRLAEFEQLPTSSATKKVAQLYSQNCHALQPNRPPAEEKC